jgi:hypothetical protein
MKTALELFRMGHDTFEIHRILRIPEPSALKLVNEQRSAELCLKSPYRKYEPNLSARNRWDFSSPIVTRVRTSTA